MKHRGPAVVLLMAIIGAVIAYPDAGNPELSENLTTTVDLVVSQQTTELLKMAYTSINETLPVGSSEIVGALIAASLPESLRQDAASELNTETYNGTLTDGLKERIRQYILDWTLQYVPKDLRTDIVTALDDYRTTGQVSEDNQARVERIRHYLKALEQGPERNKRGFWGALLRAVIRGLTMFG